MQPIHSNMRNFTAPYTFVEYPKWVKLADGSPLLVHNAEEEAAAIGPENSDTNEGDADDRAALMARAKELGLNPHPRHGVDKLREMIAGAGIGG